MRHGSRSCPTCGTRRRYREKEAAAKERLERLKAKAEAQMEEIAPYLSDGFTDEEMYKALISKGRLDNRPCLKWRPVKDKL